MTEEQVGFQTVENRLFRLENQVVRAVATDAKDGHGLKLEKVGQAFQVLMTYLQKSPKNEYFWFV